MKRASPNRADSIIQSLLATSMGCAALWSVQSAVAQSIDLMDFGLRGHFRPGEWAAVRLQVQSGLDESVPAEVTIDMPTADGDTTQCSRVVVLDPGGGTTLWLYPRLPPSTFARSIADSVFAVHAYEVREGKRVREIISARVSPLESKEGVVPLDVEIGLIGVVGDGRMGLDALAVVPTSASAIPSMNEITAIARGLDPRALPDRWEGLAAMEALVWGPAEPRLLSPPGAQAIRDWIAMGGNLVVVLPESGDPWGLLGGGTNALSDLLPRSGVRQVEGVTVKSLLPILSKNPGLLNQRATTRIHLFSMDGLDSAWEPLASLPCPRDERTGVMMPREGTEDGQVFAIRRSWGSGHITLLGVDADALQKRSLQPGGLPQADVFWNLFLGRRADTPSLTDYQALKEVNPSRLEESTPSISTLGGGDLVATLIGMRGEAAVGVLGAFAAFVLYWALAGPIGFILLKQWKLERWSWPIFTVVAASFATIAWSVGGISRIGATRIQHLTVMDAVRSGADSAVANDALIVRATSWFSVYLPTYGSELVAIGGAATPAILGSWSEPGGVHTAPFPDPGTYTIPTDSPGEYSVPARATAAMFQAHWRGSATASWNGLPSANDQSRPLVQSFSPGASPRVMLSGVISHGLPAPLRDVSLIHIGPYRSSNRRSVSIPEGLISPSDQLPNYGRIVRMGEWAPNTPLEVAAQLYPSGAESPTIEAPGALGYDLRQRYFDPIATDLWGARFDHLTTDRLHLYLEMLGMYSMLQPPRYLKNPPENGDNARVTRTLGRSLDLSLWFTRPCLIVQGFVEGSECAVPITIEGRPVPSEGTTFVRVVFPLPFDQPLTSPSMDP